MAVRISTTKENIKVICSSDDALDPSMTPEQYAAYQKSLDESLLPIIPGKQPTRFLLAKNLSFAAQKHIEDGKLGISDSGKPEFRFGFMMEEVRCALVGIENPADLPEDQHIAFAKDLDGFASRDLVASLNAAGIVSELFAARQNAAKGIPAKK